MKLCHTAIDEVLGVLNRIVDDSGDMTDAFPLDVVSLTWSSNTGNYALQRLVLDYYTSAVEAYVHGTGFHRPISSRLHSRTFTGQHDRHSQGSRNGSPIRST